MEKIKIGILGTGYIGNVHAQILAQDARTEIYTLRDIINERAVKLSNAVGGYVCESADELIDKSDAVYICTPNSVHTEFALQAIEAGKHIFCEKPFSTTMEKAEKLYAAAKDYEKVFQVGFNRRYTPVYATLKKELEADKPHSAHIKMNRGELKNPVWTGDPNVTGGFLYETTIHMFDMVRFLFGEVAEMVAYGSQHEYGEIDEFSVLLKFKNGFHCTFASSADASWIFPFERVEVFCHHRTLLTQEMEQLIDSRGMDANYQTYSWHQLEKQERWGYAQEDKAFLDAILNGTKPPVTAYDGYKSVELVESCYKAIETGEKIIFQ